jgi:hypothetical protein
MIVHFFGTIPEHRSASFPSGGSVGYSQCMAMFYPHQMTT